jgi:DNA-binding CsgD family transcriptional regulator
VSSAEPGPATSHLERGRAAYDRREWRAAYESLAAADSDSGEPLPAGDLWRLALTGHLIGRDDVFLDALERAHQSHLTAKERAPAARCAIWLGLHLAEHGEMAKATGWFGRAGRILEGNGGECVERGYLMLPVGLQHLGAGEPVEAARVASEAAECAQRFGDPDLLALAVHMEGVALLRQGRVEEGLALLDEAMVAVSTDELSPQVTGIIYCSVIGACRRVYALDRAHEWTAALSDWCDRQPDMVAYTGECRVYRAELLQLSGAWEEALDEVRRVGGREEHGDATAGAACYQEGEVHRLRGELGAAEEAYRNASRAGREPQPGLALLRLVQGDVDAAVTGIRRALGETMDPLRRARLLPAHIEIMLDAGGVDEAERACQELEQIAASYESGVLATMAAHARGAVALARNDAEAALGPLRRAWREWRGLEAPYNAARVRVLLGKACRMLGDTDTASLELEAARFTFERLGAAPDVAGLDALTRGPTDRRSHGLTPRELEVLALVATGKTNRAIADDLHISEKTVARHVSNIFTKLGLSSRSAATAYAYEHGLTGPSA